MCVRDGMDGDGDDVVVAAMLELGLVAIKTIFDGLLFELLCKGLLFIGLWFNLIEEKNKLNLHSKVN